MSDLPDATIHELTQIVLDAAERLAAERLKRTDEIVKAAVAWRDEWVNYAHDNVPTTQRLLDAINESGL